MPPDAPETPQNLPPEPPQSRPLYGPGSRYSDLAEHELWQLLDDMDDERTRARRREAFYVSTIVYLLIAWFIFYGPQWLWHQPRMLNPADVLKERNLTYLDLPPDALKPLKPKNPPKVLSDKDRVEQTRTPTLDKKTLQHLQEQEPPQPQPQPAQLPPAPQPQAPVPQQAPPMRAQNNLPSILEAPRPQPQNPSLNTRSLGDTMQRLAENARPTRPGLSGMGMGDITVPHHSGLKAPVEVLSDTTGANPDELNAYLRRLLHDVKQTWLPLIPEEAQPPLLKQGETTIRFVIAPDGHVIGMQLVDSTHDNALNRAAWGSITGTAFGPLPRGMKDPNLTLLIRYMVNEPLE